MPGIGQGLIHAVTTATGPIHPRLRRLVQPLLASAWLLPTCRWHPLEWCKNQDHAASLLQHVRNRWSIENSWHWPRDTQLRENVHRYREGNGAQIMATLRSLAMNALRLDGPWSISEGLAALAHEIPGLLALLGWRELSQPLSSA